jgi:hypothetical protein
MQYPAEVAEFQEKKIPFRPHRSSRLPLATARGQVGGHSGYVSPIDSSTDAVNPLPNGGVFRWPTTKAEKGDGRLSFEADAFGVLAQEGYGVGATRGESEAANAGTAF